MKILQINTVYGTGSTGKIAKEIHDICKDENIECYSAYRCNTDKQIYFEDSIEISSVIDSRIHGFIARLTMFKGCCSFIKTLNFIKRIKKYSPNIIHIHNLHGSYVNIPLLFRYIKRNNIPVVWTLHDCWSFTAICSHFSIAKCDRWKTGCNNCPQRKKISLSVIDNTRIIWQMKKKWFSDMENVAIITPSHWLEELAKQSILNKYSIKTIYNGINLDVFKPSISNFRQKYNLNNKKIVLGVAFEWGYSKGLDIILKLAERLSDEYAIVIVGCVDLNKIILPSNIIAIERTESQTKLAELYTSADVLVNPTREEVLGLVNIEALACGTPVVTFKSGGSPECIDCNCGCIVEIDDIDAMEKEVIRICTEHPYSQSNCINRAKMFDKDNCLKEYINLYKKIYLEKHI